MEEIFFHGRMSEVKFLSRLYQLEKLPSYDNRCENALQDIAQHTEWNNDYQGNWAFEEDRFQLYENDDKFLKFLCEMAHPLVRPDNKQAQRILTIANDWLKVDGWELFPIREIAGGNILGYRETNAVQKPREEEVEHIWTADKLRFFISHRDIHKVEAKKLGASLTSYGISSFVAHDSIQAMSTWKHEIMKALKTMDACICFITKDFYESEWTNQEIGYALARGVPIYLYSVDGSDPKGFKLDTQAIKTGFSSLVNCIKQDFLGTPKLKKIFIDNFADAKDGNWDHAKNMFFDLVGLEFNNEEIEAIVEAINTKAKYNNQLLTILNDKIKPEHLSHPRLKTYTHYREYLDKDILKKHSSHEYFVSSDNKNRFFISSKKHNIW